MAVKTEGAQNVEADFLNEQWGIQSVILENN